MLMSYSSSHVCSSDLQQFVLLQVVQTARNAMSSQIARGRCQDTACLTQAADGDVAVGLVLARTNGYVYVVVNDVQVAVGGLHVYGDVGVSVGELAQIGRAHV